MRRSLCGIVAALALAAYAAPAAAASSVEVTMIYNPFVIYPGEIDAWFVGVDGHISAGRGGLQASTIDLRSDLDVAEVDAGLVVEPRLDFEEHKFGIEFWRVAYCGFENLRRDLTYSDQFYPAGVEVKTALLFKSVSLLYEYDIIHHPRGAYSLGPVFGIDFLATEADLEAATGSGFESVHTTLPLVGLAGELEIVDNFFVAGRAAGFGTGTDSIVDLKATLLWRWRGTFEVSAGYRYIALEIDSDPFQAECRLSGFMAGLGLRF